MGIHLKRSRDVQEVANTLRDWIEYIEESRKTTDRIALELYKNYNSIRDKRFYNGDADVFVPLSFMIVETVVAKLIKSIFNEPIPVPMVGVGPSDKDKQERVRALLHMQQKSQVKLWLKLLDYLRAKCIFPRAYAQMNWRTDYRKVKKPVSQEAESESSQVLTEGAEPPPTKVKVDFKEELVVEYDCWDFTNLDFFDMGVDPMAADGDIQRAAFTYHRTLVSDEDLRIMAAQEDEDGEKLYAHMKQIVEVGEAEELEEVLDKKTLIGLDIDNLMSYKKDGAKRHEMHTCYMDYSMDGDDFVDKRCLFILLDRQVLIRAEKNPFWHGKRPYISGSFYRRPNEFLGMSLIQPIRKMQYEINDKRNQELDYATMALMPMWVVGDDAGIEDPQIRATQEGVIRVGDINQIRQMTMPDLTMVGQRSDAIMEANIRETTGVTRAVQGVSGAGPRQSATQFSQQLSQASDRIFLMLETFGNEEWPELWGMAHSLNQQHLREDTMVRMTEKEASFFSIFGSPELTGELDEDGQPGLKTTPQEKVTMADMQVDMDFYGASFQEIEDENIRNANILQFFQIVSNIPPTPDNQSFFNIVIRKFWTKVLKLPMEELVNDAGEPLLLTHPGAASAFDETIIPPESIPAEEGGAQGTVGGLDTDAGNILQDAFSSIPTGGLQ